MSDRFSSILAVGGKSNSLGRVPEVVDLVLHDQSRLSELYNCLFHEDAWLRMRAADAIEKVCRQHPDWLLPYIDRFQSELGSSPQPSIQWHLAQIYRQVALTAAQKQAALRWLKDRLTTTATDWIVAANAMVTLVQFTKDGATPLAETVRLLEIQREHKSKSVVKRADKLLAELQQ